jgi:hypothetical protein
MAGLRWGQSAFFENCPVLAKVLEVGLIRFSEAGFREPAGRSCGSHGE